MKILQWKEQTLDETNTKNQVEKSERSKKQRRLIEEHLRKQMTEQEVEALAIILKVKTTGDS